MTLANRCVAGEKRMQQLDPDAYRPRINVGFEFAVCHLCEQKTMLKKDGFFRQHASSQLAPGVDRGQSHGRQGEPGRVRGRGR